VEHTGTASLKSKKELNANALLLFSGERPANLHQRADDDWKDAKLDLSMAEAEYRTKVG
jgi:hypothetical protein